MTGPAGVGKSFIASALGHQACFAGYKVRYANMQKLLEDMHMARIESKAARFFDKMAALDQNRYIFAIYPEIQVILVGGYD